MEEEDRWQWVEECMRNKEVQAFLSRSLEVKGRKTKDRARTMQRDTEPKKGS